MLKIQVAPASRPGDVEPGGDRVYMAQIVAESEVRGTKVFHRRFRLSATATQEEVVEHTVSVVNELIEAHTVGGWPT
jgi:hypothetical protein